MNTFKISDVGRPGRPLPSIDAQASMRRVLGHPFEAAAANLGDLVDFVCPNLLLGTALAAFAHHFPLGFGLAPFTWDYRGEELPMRFVAGFAGVSQDPATLALRPAIGWAVADAAERQDPPASEW